MPDFERIRGPYVIATDPARLDRRLIHRFLSEESYWCPGVPYEVVDRSIDNSLNFGTHDAHGLYEQFGFKPLERVERFMAVERNPEELYGRGRK